MKRKCRPKALAHDRYGPLELLRLEEVERRTPKEDSVLVGVHARREAVGQCVAA
jgi:hypothetical protein